MEPWGPLAALMGGAPRPDGQGPWTLSPAFRTRFVVAHRRAATAREQQTRRRDPRTTEAQRRENRQLAVDVARAVHAALLALEREPSPVARAGGPTPKPLPAGLVERAWAMYETGVSMRKAAAAVVGETPYGSVGSLRNRLEREFDARGLERRERAVAARAALVTHGAYVGRDRESINAHRRRVRGPGLRYCAGMRQQGNARPRPCKKPAMEGSDYCYGHDPAHAAERAEQTAEMRSLRGRAGNTTTNEEGSP